MIKLAGSYHTASTLICAESKAKQRSKTSRPEDPLKSPLEADDDTRKSRHLFQAKRSWNSGRLHFSQQPPWPTPNTKLLQKQITT